MPKQEKEKDFDTFFTEATEEKEEEEEVEEESEEEEQEEPINEEEAIPADSETAPIEDSEVDELEKIKQELKEEREKREHAEQQYRSFHGRYAKEKEEWAKKLEEKEAESETEETGQEEVTGSLKEFIDDYPELAGPIRTMIRNEFALLMQDYKQTLNSLKSEVEPLKKQYTLTAEELHIKTIRDAHPDVDSIAQSKEFSDWVKSRPSYVQKEIARVYESGSAQEVIDLLTDFKESTGKPKTKRSATNKPNIPIPPKVEEDDRVKRLRDASAVPSSRSKPPKEDNESQDFDSVFNEIT